MSGFFFLQKKKKKKKFEHRKENYSCVWLFVTDCTPDAVERRYWGGCKTFVVEKKEKIAEKVRSAAQWLFCHAYMHNT